MLVGHEGDDGMGRTRRVLGLAALAALIGPPIAAALRKRDARDVGDATSDDVRIGAYFEGRRFESQAAAFRGGAFESWYAALDIDLRETTLDPAGATITVQSVFSGVRVVVPDGWRIAIHPRAFAGGITDDTDGGAVGGPLLTVQATAVFGGVQVTTSAETAWIRGAPAEHSGNGHGGNGRAAGLALAEKEAAAEAVEVVEPAEAADATTVDVPKPAARKRTAAKAASEAPSETGGSGGAEEPAP
jgi:hypothetical protein